MVSSAGRGGRPGPWSMSSSPYALDPFVGPGDHRLRGAGWDELDRAGAAAIGRSCVVVPSVRVGLSWTLAHLGLRRHQDHVLVPRFLSRCILTTLSRRSLPVEVPTERTRIALVVHQYGLRQDLAAIAARCAERGIPYLEDAAYGPDQEEALGPGALARFVGLTKTLPVLRGALVLSDDEGLLEALRRRRDRDTAWSLVVLAALSILRTRRTSVGHSDLAELAYEMYDAAGGGDRWTRGNILRGLERLAAFGEAGRRRRQVAVTALGPDLLVEPRAATPYLGMLMRTDPDASAVLTSHGFSADRYNIDIARDLFAPRYEQGVLVPFNPRIPLVAYEQLLAGLARVLPRGGRDAG